MPWSKPSIRLVDDLLGGNRVQRDRGMSVAMRCLDRAGGRVFADGRGALRNNAREMARVLGMLGAAFPGLPFGPLFQMIRTLR